MNPDDDRIELRVPSHPRYLSVTRAVLCQVGRCMGFDEADTCGIVQSVDEAVTNVIKYSYEMDFSRDVVVACRLAGDRLEIRIRDFGKKVDVGKIRPRERHDLEPGGLGVRLIKAYMDEVLYDTSMDTGTELKLVKYKAGKEKGGVGGDR